MNTALKQKHRALGLCNECKESALYPFRLCKKHLLAARAHNRKRMREIRSIWKLTGYCMRCGVKLDTESGGSDIGFLNCFNCRKHIYGEKIYAGHDRKENLCQL